MKKSELIKIIELVVRKEVKKQVKQILITENSIKSKPVVKSKPKPKTKVHRNYTSNLELNKVLNETVGLSKGDSQEEEWPTMGGGTFDSSRATAIASPNAKAAVVLVVGARSKGQASSEMPVSMLI